MAESRADQWVAEGERFMLRHWRWVIVALWLAYALFIIANRWARIEGFALADTDDNLRMAQVRALIGGQGWFDLTQYRFDPAHGGANIHWSRLVDLPLAGIILALKPFLGGANAERAAVAIAPLIPLLPLMFALSLTMRRLVSERAWVLPVIGLLCAYSTIGMFGPTRIDHHGWQLALLAVAVSGIADRKRARGGATVGIATGLSLSIGLEMLIYLGLLGGATVLMWVHDRDQRRRLATYAAALAATTGLAFLIFASNANRIAVCDALSPVWLSDAAVGGAVMLALAWVRLADWRARLGAAMVAGGIVAGFHALAWPNCLERLEGVSVQATELWLSHVREARPFYRHSWKIGTVALALPVTALFGWALLLWRAWKQGEEGRDLLARTAAVALPAVAAFGLLFWQMRAAPAAQMMALPAATALVVLVAAPWFQSPKLWHHAAAVGIALLGLGALVPLATQLLPGDKPTAAAARVGRANGLCPTLAAMSPVQRQPKGVVFSFIDLGPRLISVTHHDAIGGPYHRNDRAIADVMLAFRGDEANARRTITEYGADYVLVCPDMSTATIFMAEAPKGFYAGLVKGRVPAWLTPIDLGPKSPLKMWKVVR